MPATSARRARKLPSRRVSARLGRRMDDLYEINLRLLSIERGDELLADVIAIVRRTLPLRSAVCIGDSAPAGAQHADARAAGGARASRAPAVVVWRDPDVDDAELARAQAHAGAMDAYLRGVRPAAALAALAAPDAALARSLDLPLAVADGGVFGLVQLQCAAPVDERDVFFANLVVNQLALALWRQRAAERAERARLDAERRFAATQALHERYEALVDNLDDAYVWEADAATLRLTYVSRRASELLGVYVHALAEHELRYPHLVDAADRASVTRALHAVRTGMRDGSFLHRSRAAGGATRWFRTGVHVAKRADGTALLQGVSVDVTALKLAEERAALLAEASKLLAAGDDVRTRVAGVSALALPRLGDACFVDVHDAAGGLTRIAVAVAPRSAADAAAVDRVGAADRWLVDARRAAMGGAVIWSFPPEAVDAAGADAAGADEQGPPAGVTGGLVVPLIARGACLGVAAFVALAPRVFTADDVELAADLCRRTSSAVDAARLVDATAREVRARQDLLAVVSHDLRAPLGAMILQLELLQRRGGLVDPERVERQLRSLTGATERALRLVDDLLDSASIEHGSLALDRAPCAPAELLRSAVDLFAPVAEAHGVRLEDETHATAAALPHVFADARRVQQVLANLIGNAIKFTPPRGHVRVRVREGAGAPDARGEIVFEIADDGSGIQAADLPHVFDRFWRADETAHRGRGLGLFIVQGLVAAHGGRVWVESTPGAGATFTFTLPCHAP